MSTGTKPDIYLEMGTGFFRIPTPQATYHITVLNFADTSATRIVEKIVESEKSSADEPQEEQTVFDQESADKNDSDSEQDGNFYQEISEEIYGEIGQLAKSLSSTLIDIPAEDRLGKRVELDEAGEKIDDAKNQLRDIVEMTEKAAMAIMDNVESVQSQTDDVRELLSGLKDHKAFQVTMDNNDGNGEGQDNESPLAAEINEVKAEINKAAELLTAIQNEESPSPPAAPEIKTEKKTRYLFDLDVVFQTLYELCTNETVKDHITGAREKAGEIFDTEKFYDEISPKAAEYEADEDNFFSVPMSDVFNSLFAACKEKAIGNLLKKMDAGQSSIFLDQTIPLEVPATEEIEIEISAEAPAPAPESSPPDPRLAEVSETIDLSLEKLAALEEKSLNLPPADSCSGMTLEDQHEIFAKIEDAFGVAATICNDVTRITEALSFQDLSGQQIMKIIKLLSDFQIQLLGIVVSFGSKLKHKQDNANLTVNESEKLAQADVDNYLNKLTGSVDKKEGVLDQDTVNNMLEELGF
jgi:chemotaxis regulatin CheY-phosphate phosphatase CheZ